jgi:hypothetical protein
MTNDVLNPNLFFAVNQELQPQQFSRRAARYAHFQIHRVSVSSAYLIFRNGEEYLCVSDLGRPVICLSIHLKENCRQISRRGGEKTHATPTKTPS